MNKSYFQGSTICFLLDINYRGVNYRLSSFPVDLFDLSDNTITSYVGGFADPDINEITEFQGIQIEVNSIPVEIVIPSINWVKEWTNGRVFDGAKCTISMITVVQDQTAFFDENKIHLFTGRSTGAIFGDPKKPIGNVAFSIENNTNVESKKLLDSQNLLEISNFSNLVWVAEGSYIPFVFGLAGKFPIGYADQIVEYDHVLSTPVYPTIKGIGWYRFIVAYGQIKAQELRIYDKNGGNFVNPVFIDTDSNDRIYSYVDYIFGSTIEDHSFALGLNSDVTAAFWAQWSEYDGAMLYEESPEGYLTGAGDIILFMLAQTSLDYDENAWQGLRSLLNKFKFAGYINDPEVTIWEWLKTQIIAYLPIEVINGGEGLKPVLNMYFWDENTNPNYHLNDSGETEIITGLQPLDYDVINKLVLKFAYEPPKERYKSTIIISGNMRAQDQSATYNLSQLAKTSFENYGLQEKVIQLDHVYDYNTAQMIAKYIIRTSAAGAYGLDISAGSRYGYMGLGDVISLTSDKLGLLNHKCQIIGKSWNNGRWIFSIFLENNKEINP